MLEKLSAKSIVTNLSVHSVNSALAASLTNEETKAVFMYLLFQKEMSSVSDLKFNQDLVEEAKERELAKILTGKWETTVITKAFLEHKKKEQRDEDLIDLGQVVSQEEELMLGKTTICTGIVVVLNPFVFDKTKHDCLVLGQVDFGEKPKNSMFDCEFYLRQFPIQTQYGKLSGNLVFANITSYQAGDLKFESFFSELYPQIEASFGLSIFKELEKPIFKKTPVLRIVNTNSSREMEVSFAVKPYSFGSDLSFERKKLMEIMDFVKSDEFFEEKEQYKFIFDFNPVLKETENLLADWNLEALAIRLDSQILKKRLDFVMNNRLLRELDFMSKDPSSDVVQIVRVAKAKQASFLS